MDNERYFDKIRAEYQAAIADSSEAYANIGRLLDERLKGRVVDFGCGGIINYQMAHLEHLTCVDLMPPPAPASGANSWEQGDFYSYDFSAGPDQVLVQFLLHHLPEDEQLEAALRRLARDLPPGGKLVIVEMLLTGIAPAVQWLLRPLIRLGLNLLGKPDIRFFSQDSLTNLLQRTGFGQLSWETVDVGTWVAPAPVLFPKLRMPGKWYPLRCVVLEAAPVPATCPACAATVASTMDLVNFTLYGCGDCGCWWSDALRRQATTSFTPEKYFSQPDGDRPRWQDLLRRLPGLPRSVLDVGCGNGAFLQFLGEAAPVARLAGIELDSGRAREARERKPTAEIHESDALAAVAAGADPFDLITLWDVFEHVPDPAALLQSLATRLVPEGRLFLQTIHEDSVVPRLGRLSYRLTGGLLKAIARRTHDAHHLTFFTRPALELMALGAGLEVETLWYDRLARNRMDGSPLVTYPTAALLALENLSGNGLFLNAILRKRG